MSSSTSRALVPAGDYRLAVPAATVWLVTAIGLWHPGIVAAPAMIALGVFAAAVFGGARRLGHNASGDRSVSPLGSALLVLALAVAVAVPALAALSLRLDARDGHPLAHRTGKTRLVVTVRDDPVRVGPAERGQVRVRVGVSGGVAELVGSSAQWSELVPGQRVSVMARVRPPRGGDLVVARLTAIGDPTILGRPPPHQRFAGLVRERLRDGAARALGPQAAGLLPGLVLGDTSMLDDDVRDDFRAAGLTHLTAVSGANIALVCGAGILLVQLLGGSPRVTVVVGVVLLGVFVLLVRPSPSVVRAAMMGTVGLLALATARRAQAMPALGAAVLVGVLVWPELAVSPAFALSVVATLGLVLWAGGLRDWLRAHRVPGGIAEVLAMAIAAHLVTAPLIAVLSGRFSVVAIVANVLVAPIVGVISVTGTVAAVLAVCGGPEGFGVRCADLILRALGPELWWMLGCARLLGRLPLATVAVPSGMAGAAVVAIPTVALVVGAVWQHGRREGTPASAARRRRLPDRSGDLRGGGRAVRGRR